MIFRAGINACLRPKMFLATETEGGKKNIEYDIFGFY